MNPTIPQSQSMPMINQELQRKVDHWFGAGHEMLWIPICEVADTPMGIDAARQMAEQIGGPKLIRDESDLLALPIGIRGWLFPAHLDDTDVVCYQEAPGEISFGQLRHPVTGEWLTYRYDTEAPIRRQGHYFRNQSAS